MQRWLRGREWEMFAASVILSVDACRLVRLYKPCLMSVILVSQSKYVVADFTIRGILLDGFSMRWFSKLTCKYEITFFSRNTGAAIHQLIAAPWNRSRVHCEDNISSLCNTIVSWLIHVHLIDTLAADRSSGKSNEYIQQSKLDF